MYYYEWYKYQQILTEETAMSTVFPSEFDRIISKAKALEKPMRVAVAAADAPNILRGVFQAQDDGFVTPILVGNEEKIKAVMDSIGESGRSVQIEEACGGDNPVQYAIEMINAGNADVLMRGNVQTRDYLMPVLNKANHLIRDKALVTHVTFLKVPEHDRLLAISDVTLLIKPTADEKILVLQNMVEAMKLLGIEKPNIALLALVEKPVFHMRDTVEDQTICRQHLEKPYADCNLVGPIAYDLIMSKEAARLKNFNCEYCGEFDGIVVPDLMSGNLLVKSIQFHTGALGFSILVGAKIPIAIAGRSDAPEQTYLSLAACAAGAGNR